MSETGFLACLSVRQPWAGLWLREKDVENRGWYMAHRGPLLVHASKTIDESGVHEASLVAYPDGGVEAEEFEAALFSAAYRVVGAIIGMVWVEDCRKGARLSRWHVEGEYGIYRRPLTLIFPAPVAWPGKLGVFYVPRVVVRSQLQAAREAAGRAL